jgi:O-antigen ligase
VTELRHPWGAARICLAAALLGYAWRLQDLFTFIDPIKPLTLATAAVVATMLLDRRLVSELAPIASRPPALFAVILAALASVGVPFSLYPGLSFSIALSDLFPAVALMIGIGAAIEYPLDAYRLSGVHVIGAVIFSLVVLTRYSVGTSGRLGDLAYYDANDLGLLLICTLPLAEWGAFHGARTVTRIAAVCALPVFLLTIVKTGSRGAFVGLVAVVAYGIFANRSAPLRRRFQLGVVVALLLVGTAGAQYWTFISTMFHPTEDYNWTGNSSSGRMDVWQRGIGYMVANPITGVGIGAFPVAEGTISPLAGLQDYDIGVKWSAAHNSFVQVGAELGIPGLLVFLALVLTGLRSARRSVRLGLALGDDRAASMGDALAASLVGYVVSGFFLSQGYSSFAYSLIGIAIGLHAALTRAVSVSASAIPTVEGMPQTERVATELSAWT